MATRAPIVRRRVHIAMCVLLAICAAWGLLFVLSSSTDASAVAQPIHTTADACTGLTGVAQTECNALIALYTATDGDQWIVNDQWLSTTPGVSHCDWHGVTCTDGQVTALELSRNRLTGSLPPEIGGLGALTHLLIDGNRLRGRVPAPLCLLRDNLIETDLGYNALETFNTRIRQCLNQLDPDWAQTQTAPPRRISATAITSDSIQLNWQPIPYIGDGGGYVVSYADELTGTYTVHGQTADKNATGYLLNNLPPGKTVFVQVRSVTPAHAANPDMLRSEPAPWMGVTVSDETILLAVYAAFDNDLSEYGVDIVDRLRVGSANNPNVRAVVLVDRRGEGNSDIVVVEGGQVQRTDAVSDRWGVAEVDTADPAVLAWFLTYARTNYAATRTFAFIVGHGVGPAPEIQAAQPSTRSKAPPLPQGQEYTPGDVTSLTYMSTVELGRALAEATDNGADPLDLIFFDQCFQGNLDVLYEIRQAAQIFVASPNYAWLSAPYARYVVQMAPAASTESIADAMIRVYEGSLDNTHPNAIFWVSRTQIEDLAAALDTLAVALGKALFGGQQERILSAAQESRHADTTQCGTQRYILAPPDELIGMGRFALNLRATFVSGDPAGVHAAADNVMAQVADVHRNYRIGQPYIAPDQLWDYDDALTILAPLRRNAPGTVAWRASIYTQTAPMTATWAVDASQILTIPTSLALTRDGIWDDFLSAWYTDLGTPTVGQWCNYMPPARVIDANAEAITLTLAAAGDDSVMLTWDETNDESAEAYWLFARAPTDLDWVLQATFPLTQTSSIQTGLTPDASYRYAVLARNAEGVFIARSNEATWEQPTITLRLYLPAIVNEAPNQSAAQSTREP